ncbi:MAG: ribonuclease HI [Flavobacteriaceae bacterium]|nr:ribonuclease HI [Flavobacteriaceae bacterium]|tara:strand:- start:7928 stop:8386 length:459 start_codon:yes stop_codon:yes gene_type:complete
MKQVIIYTDGSSRGNPGPGGYGIILEWDGHKRELSEGFIQTTNNRMELLAVIVSLESLKRTPMDVVIYSDSKYVVDSVEKKWVFEWEKKSFKKKKNSDLWKRFLKVYRNHNVNFHWIKGHNHHPENERCDFIAVKASNNHNLLVDKGYIENE